MQKMTENEKIEYHRAYLRANIDNLLTHTQYWFKAIEKYNFIVNWHHEAICEHLEAVYNGDLQHLIINVPPGYSKTKLVTDMFCSWSFARADVAKIAHPNFIHTSYSQDLVHRNSNQVKNIIKHERFKQFFSGVEIDNKNDSATSWKTTKQGGFLAVSSMGQITGFHAGRKLDDGNFYGALIIDDPLKPADADSDVEREKVNRWITGVVESRLSFPKKTPIVLIMQRVHERDLCGYIKSGNTGLNFEELVLPIIDENRPLKRRILWEFMHDENQINSLKKDPYTFASQYMQNPRPEGGGIFQSSYWQRYTHLPELEHKVITVDIAVTEKTQSDYTVCHCWGKYLNKVYLIDSIRFKTEDPSQKIADFYNKHRPRTLYVEKNAYGTGIISNLKNNYGIPVQAVWQSKDKIARAKDVISYCASGFVHIPEQAEWVSDLILELETFPNAQHDDQVDCLTLGIEKLLGSSGNMLYERFNRDFNVSEVEYNKELPLLICYNAINQPAVIFAQSTSTGQLRILESIVAENEDREGFIKQIKAVQANNYRDSLQKFFLLAHSEKSKTYSPFDFNTMLQAQYGRFPEFYDISQKMNDVIDLVSKSLIDTVYDYKTSVREAKILINPRCDVLIKAFEGGLTFEEVQSGSLKANKKILEQYPYTNIANSLHQLAYNVFISQEFEQSKEYNKPKQRLTVR